MFTFQFDNFPSTLDLIQIEKTKNTFRIRLKIHDKKVLNTDISAPDISNPKADISVPDIYLPMKTSIETV